MVPTIALTHPVTLRPRRIKSTWVKSVEYRDGFLLVQMNDMVYAYVAPTWVAGLLRAWSSQGMNVGQIWRRLKDSDKWGGEFTVVAKFKAPASMVKSQDRGKSKGRGRGKGQLMNQLKQSLRTGQLELNLQ